MASDDFLSQLRVPCVGDAAEHPNLQATAWPHVLSLGGDAIAAAGLPQAASSSQAVVMRAVGNCDSDGSGGSGGSDGLIAALYSLHLQEHGVPRRAHRRLALATARCDAAGALVHSRLALSDPLPVPAAVLFSAP